MNAERTEELAVQLARAHANKTYIKELRENPVWQDFQAEIQKLKDSTQTAHEDLASTPEARAEHLRSLLLLRDKLKPWLDTFERENKAFLERNKIKSQP